MNNANTISNTDKNALPSIAVSDKAVVTVESQKAQQQESSQVPEYLYIPVIKEDVNTGDLYESFDVRVLPPAKYNKIVKLEEIEIPEQALIAKTVDEYSTLFRKAEERSAREILEMCRIVYEASATLDSAKFHEFCQRIGYRDTSSTIRKHIVIGKLQPRLIQYADALPATWTGIYTITQIPAQIFVNLMNDNKSFKEMPVSQIKGYVDDLELKKNVDKYVRQKVMTQDEKDKFVTETYPLATVCFTKAPDDLDWAAVKKALLEIEAHLPIKIHFVEEMSKIFNFRKVARYTKLKKQQNPLVYKPETWDLGRDVEKMSKIAGGEIATNESDKTAA